VSPAVATSTRISRFEPIGPLLAGPKRFTRLWLAFVSASIFGGALLRLINLGKYGFWTDEYFHVFAAKSFLQGDSLFVPMVGYYGRAKLVTALTTAMFWVFGESEFAARLPFALANIFFLGVAAVVVRRLFSETVSAAAVFCLAFAPFAIDISRECRFYTLHQLFYFGAAYALLAGFENIAGRMKPDGRKASMDWRWIAAALPMAAVALHLQELTVNLGVVIACYLAVMFAFVVVRQGWVNALISKYGITLFLGIAGATAVYLLKPEMIQAKLREAMQINNWQVAKGYTDHFYRYYFTDNFPALTFLFPVGAYVAFRRYGKSGLYTVCAAAPLLLLHSFFFARKSERYIFYLFPFFVITAVIAIEPILEWGWEKLRVNLKSEPLRAKVVAAAFLLPGFLVLVHPWILTAAKAPFRAKHPDWKSLDDQFKRNLRGATIVTTNPQAFIYYVGKSPEYYRLAEISRRYAYEPTLVRTPDQFSAVLKTKGELYFVGAEWNFYNDAFMNPEMRNAVQYLMSPVDHGGDPRIVAFHD
jgi:4-amino-4-deoxy-L-arabinose transferase-like glycosyltransferase